MTEPIPEQAPEPAAVPTPPARAETPSSVRVSAELVPLDGLEARPVAEHPAVLESVHESLRTMLLESDG